MTEHIDTHDDELDPRQKAEEQEKLRQIEELVRVQAFDALRALLEPIAPDGIARILEALPPDDSIVVWELVSKERGEEILEDMPEALHEDLDEAVDLPDEAMAEVVRHAPATDAPRRQTEVHVFEQGEGRLRQIEVNTREELAATTPIWVDLLAPSRTERQWIAEIFGLKLPDADDLTDLEESARFFIAENGEVHLHSEFLLDKEEDSRNVAVAFILHNNIVFSMREEELPVFRLQRLRARIQPGYVSEGRDVLIDLYGANVEYSADALEDVYRELEDVGRNVLSPHVSDEEAAEILYEIAKEEDLNGRIRRNVLDTRRALSFLMRARQLSDAQQNDARQILRDIDSLDGHTSFLFGKINFLMDATVGFININQNKRVSRLTAVSVVFLPINIIAGIGGMSEFSMMTAGVPWPLAYGGFIAIMTALGVGTYFSLRHLESQRTKKLVAASRSR